MKRTRKAVGLFAYETLHPTTAADFRELAQQRDLLRELRDYLARAKVECAKEEAGPYAEQAKRAAFHARNVERLLVAKPGACDPVTLAAECLWLEQSLAQLWTNVLFEKPVRAGDKVIRGGRRGAEAKHGSAVSRQARHDEWRQRYAELRRKFPERGHVDLTDQIAEEFGTTGRTVRNHVENPTPTRRGRRHK